MAVALPEEHPEIDQSANERDIERPYTMMEVNIAIMFRIHATYCVWTQNMVEGD